MQIPQNKLIRFVTGKHNHSHVGTSEFKELNWLHVEQRVAPIKLNLVYRIVNCSAPDYLQKDFSHVSQVHKYSTCFSISSLFIPSVKNAGKPTFTYTAVKLWNELPKNICLKSLSKAIYLIKCNRKMSIFLEWLYLCSFVSHLVKFWSACNQCERDCNGKNMNEFHLLFVLSLVLITWHFALILCTWVIVLNICAFYVCFIICVIFNKINYYNASYHKQALPSYIYYYNWDDWIHFQGK